MIDKYATYAKHVAAADDVQAWISTHLAAHLKTEPENQTEIEHIIDYLASSDRPKRISKMSYAQAKANTDKWNAALIKKGAQIKEAPDDVKVVKDFGDGFKIVQLVGENAYKREGFLMRHCAGNYYGKSVKLYSLRDANNMPHCTMEEGQQIKGKGNGSIDPKYVGYIVEFLEQVGMTVGDNEMRNLGYINIEKILDKVDAKKSKLYKNKYLYEGNTLYAKDGEEYCDFDLWYYKPLVVETGSSVKIKYDLKAFLQAAIKKLLSSNKNKKIDDKNSVQIGSSGDSVKIGSSGSYVKIGSSGYSAQIGSSGYSAQIGSSGDYTKIGSSGDYTKIGSSGYAAQIGSSGDRAKIGSSGDCVQIGSSGSYVKIGSSGDYVQIGSSGDYVQIGSSGNHARIGSSGYSAQIGSSGDYVQIGSSGDRAKIGSSGYAAQIGMSGVSSIGMATGICSSGKVGPKGCLALARWVDAEKRYRVSVGYEGENIKADTWYTLDDNGNFMEVK